MKSLTNLLGLLTSVYLQHWNGHWKVMGENSYGDHLMLQRLYEALPVEIDTLAEKIVANSGEVFDALDHHELTGQWLRVWKQSAPSCPLSRSLAAEETLQKALHLIFQVLETSNSLPLGMNDYLAALANTHDTHVYLLRQRLRKVAATNQLSERYFQARDDLLDTDQPDSLPVKEGPVVPIDPAQVAPSAESLFWDNPEKKEVREFAESGQITNQNTTNTPPTVEDITEMPGAEELSTLNRFEIKESP